MIQHLSQVTRGIKPITQTRRASKRFLDLEIERDRGPLVAVPQLPDRYRPIYLSERDGRSVFALFFLFSLRAFSLRQALRAGSLREIFCPMAGLGFVSSHGFVLRLPRVSVSDPPPDPELITFLRDADLERLGGYRAGVVPFVRSLLLLAAGDLERAHRLVQEASNVDGTYIHGIVHRIEGDFDNARYWFGRTAVQPAAAEIYRHAAANSPKVASRATWDPIWVTDWVETSRNEVDEELRTVLRIEAEVLLERFGSATD